MEKRYKYPRTLHLPFSEHVTTDDKIMSREQMESIFCHKAVVVTEKMDGEGMTMYRDGIHARSMDSRDHPSRHIVKALWATIRMDIPIGFRICGENLAAEHSIHYRNLEDYFYVFGIWDEKNKCLSWDDTLSICESLGILPCPTLWRGNWDEERIRECYTGKSVFSGSYDAATKRSTGREVEAQEGYVVRIADGFPFPSGEDNERLCLTEVGKFVRKGHVTTEDHWLNQIPVANELKDR